MRIFWATWLCVVCAGPPSSERQVLRGGVPATKVVHFGRWEPAAVPEAARRPLLTLTEADVAKAVNAAAPESPVPPALCVRVAVGHPAQLVTLALDTASGSTWLIDIGARIVQDGELRNLTLYRPLGSSSAKFIEAAEVRPRVRLPLDPLRATGDIVGRIVVDDVRIAGTSIPMQPLMLAEKLPPSVLSWRVAGLLGLGMRSSLVAPLTDRWRAAWIDGPFDTTTVGELQTSNAKSAEQAPSGRLRSPVISIWPERGASWNDDSMRLGLGSLDSTVWSPLARDSDAWATTGSVVVDLGGGAVSGTRWPASLLIDAALPSLGVPAEHLHGLLRALLPESIQQLCWWREDVQLGLIVQCHCDAARSANDMSIELSGKRFALSAQDLFFFSVDTCTARFWPLQGPAGGPWRLGEPFLRRYAVTLDVPRQRVGFAPPPPSQLGELVEEDIWEDTGALLLKPVDAVGDGITSALHAVVMYAPAEAFGVFFLLALIFMIRGASARVKSRWEEHGDEWLPVATSDGEELEPCLPNKLELVDHENVQAQKPGSLAAAVSNARRQLLSCTQAGRAWGVGDTL